MFKDGAIYKKDTEELSLRGFCRDKKQVVSKIKNILALLHLEIVNHVCSLHSDVNSFLHAVVFIHKIIKTFGSMQIILIRSRLCAQPRLLQ